MLTRGGDGTPFYDAQKAAKPAQALTLLWPVNVEWKRLGIVVSEASDAPEYHL